MLSRSCVKHEESRTAKLMKREQPIDVIAFPTEHFFGLQILAAGEPNAVSSVVTVSCHVNAA